MVQFVGKTVLVRDHRAGVHVGVLVSLDLASKSCVLRDARKVWYWSGAASCHGIAANGLSHAESKVAPVVAAVVSCDVVEIVLCSEAGAASVMGAPVWTP
jgi:hypothetical protein